MTPRVFHSAAATAVAAIIALTPLQPDAAIAETPFIAIAETAAEKAAYDAAYKAAYERIYQEKLAAERAKAGVLSMSDSAPLTPAPKAAAPKPKEEQKKGAPKKDVEKKAAPAAKAMPAKPPPPKPNPKVAPSPPPSKPTKMGKTISEAAPKKSKASKSTGTAPGIVDDSSGSSKYGKYDKFLKSEEIDIDYESFGLVKKEQ